MEAMEIRFYNSLSRRLEHFEPWDPPRVFMYSCGPTVYDYAHIGNFRSFLFADVLRRFLELVGYQVVQVMNITDVGHMTEDQLADGGGQDKMAVAAARIKEAKKSGRLPAEAAIENPDDPYQVAAFYTKAFLEDARALRLKVAEEYPEHMPRATEHIRQMQELIGRLLERGHAYVGRDGAVYFDVQSFPEYGRLSGNTLGQLKDGAGGRVLEEHQAAKRHPADFLLWKVDPRHIMKWDSPWGVGYPGWHIECSAMAMYVLGKLAGRDGPMECIDIHTGGEDNIFPHHECEIAQSCAATGKPYFARYWLHARFLLVEGRKMSKREGNFYTVRDVLEGRVTGRRVDPAVLRYELIKGHYRSNLNFTGRGLEDSARAVGRLRTMRRGLVQRTGGRAGEVDLSHPVLKRFVEALADDLNVSEALAAIFEWEVEKEPADVALGVLEKADQVLGVMDGTGREPEEQDPEVLEKCRAIDEARRAKDFATADRIRRELQEAGYEVMTTRQGTVARKKLA